MTIIESPDVVDGGVVAATGEDTTEQDEPADSGRVETAATDVTDAPPDTDKDAGPDTAPEAAAEAEAAAEVEAAAEAGTADGVETAGGIGFLDGVEGIDAAFAAGSFDAFGPVQAAGDGDGVDPAYATDGAPVPEPGTDPQRADAELTDSAYLVEDLGPDGPPVDTAPEGSLAAVVAEHLAGPAPDGPVTVPDGRADAAQAVLDVLRASGWSDTEETAALKAEVDRLRELLDMVVRDHRARVATAASGQYEQSHWLVPLLRAAHGVSFGTLGAKVHLRTAVQDVPPEVLASAGLRIDDSGPLPAQDYR